MVARLFILALVPFAFLVSWVRRTYGDVDPRRVAAFITRHNLEPTDSNIALIERALARSRHFRATCSLIALTSTLAVLFSRAPDTFTIHFTTVFVAIMAGYLFGIVASENHWIRSPRASTRVASLELRSRAGYRNAGVRNGFWIGALLALLATLASAALSSPGNRVRVEATNGLLILAIVAAIAFMQHRIATRGRPALPAPLAKADNALRNCAVVGLDAAGASMLWMLAALSLQRASHHSSLQIRGLLTLSSIITAIAAVAFASKARKIALPKPLRSRSTRVPTSVS